MKPDGRALDIVVVGLGQAGGNLAAEFARRGYRALALNTAETDLAALEPGGVIPSLPQERRLYVGLDGYDGAGADPSYGRECLRAHADRIRSSLLKQGSGSDAVILCAGLGGGTGSALAELVEVLKNEDLPLVALMTLPTDGESALAKVNAVRAVNEIVNAPLLGWIFADNARISALHPNISVVDYFSHINARIIEPLDALNGLNARPDVTPIRSFDGEDFRKMLLSGGVLNYALAELDQLSVDEVVGAVERSIEDSELMPAGFELSRLSYLGLVIEAPENELAKTSIRLFETVASELKSRTAGAAVYQGIYRSRLDQPLSLRLIASTPSLPRRLEDILGEARREGQALGAKVAEALPPLDLGEVSDFDLFRTQSRPGPRAARLGRGSGPAPGARELLRAVPEGFERRPAWPGKVRKASSPGLPEPRPRPAPSLRSGPRPTGRLPEESEPAARPRRPRPGAATPKHRPFEGKAEAPVQADPPNSGQGTTVEPETHAKDIEPKSEAVEDLAAGADVESHPQPFDGEAGAVQASETVVFDGASLGRSAPPVATDGVDTGDLPDPNAYDRLVTDFLDPSADDERRASVIARLETDAASEITVIRYYAVEAMAKAADEVFADALVRIAAEDANAAVRSLAEDALATVRANEEATASSDS